MKKPKLFLIIITVSFVAIGLLSLGRGNNSPANLGSARSALNSVQGGYGLAPDFTLAAINSSNLTLSEYRGEKAVILDFFATWCPNCRRNIPKETALYPKYKDQVEVIGINLQESPEKVASFAKKYNIPFPVLLDPSGKVSRNYGVKYTNFHVLINKSGNIVEFIPGDISETDFQKLAEN